MEVFDKYGNKKCYSTTGITIIRSDGTIKESGLSLSETDPVFSASDAASISSTDILNWNTAFGWGNHAIAGYLLSSTAASTYFQIPVGTTAQYIRGNGTLATFPTNLSTFTNDSGYITSSALSPYLTIATALSTYQPLNSNLTSWASITRASGFDTFVATPSSVNLISLITDETGSGSLVFSTSPILVTPTIGAASGTSLVLGGTLASSAIFDLQSTSKGVLLPRLTTSQRNSISSPSTSLIVYNTDNSTLDSYDGSNWYILAGNKNNFLNAINALGSPILFEPVFGLETSNTNAVTMVNSRSYYMSVYINKTTTITGVAWYQATQGNYTSNNYNGVGLYSYSGGTMTLVASSTNDGNIWKATTSTWNQKAFSSTYIASPGIYFICCLWNSSASTTAPALGSLNGVTQNASILTTNSSKLYGTVNTNTSLASSQAHSGVTVGFPVLVALY